MSTPTSAESKELELIEKVDLRLALADTPEKFEKNLQVFLPPLLLKLASPYHSARTNVFNSLKNILSRLSSLTDVKLPVAALIQQVMTVESTLPDCHDPALLNNVKLYSLLLASKGVDRLQSKEEKKALLPIIMNNISNAPVTTAARLFHIFCKVLLTWTAPMKGTPEEQSTIEFLHLDNEKDLQFLLDHFTKFFLLVPARPDPTSNVLPRGYTCPGLSSEDVAFFTYSAGISFTKDQLLQFKNAIFNFVCHGFVADDQILIKFLSVVSTDSSNLSDRAIQFLKRLQTPYEDEDFITYLISLYTGDKTKGVPPVKSNLQEKILTILNNSIIATSDPQSVSLICSIGLHSSEVKLRSLCLNFIRHVVQYNYNSILPQPKNDSSAEFQTNIAALIRNNLHAEGWPRLQLGASTPAFAITLQQRRLQYETLGDILRKDFNLVEDLSYIEFLFDSLKGDISEFSPSIQEALLSVTGHLSKLLSPSKDKLKGLLKKILSDDTELYVQDDSISEKERNAIKDKIMSLRFVSIKFANACFEFEDAEARLLNILGTSRNNRFDIIEEATKGLQPYWFRVYRSSINIDPEHVLPTKTVLESTLSETKLPSFKSFVTLLLQEITSNNGNLEAVIHSSFGVATRFAKQCLISEAIFGKTTTVVQDEDWSLRIEKSLDIDKDVILSVTDICSKITENWYIEFLKVTCTEFLQIPDPEESSLVSKYKDVVFGEVTLALLRYSNNSVLVELHEKIPFFLKFLEGVQVTNDPELEICGNILGIISSSIMSQNSNISSILTSLKSESYSSIPLPVLYAGSFILPRLYLTGKLNIISSQQVENLVDGIISHLSETSHKRVVLKLFSQVLKFGLLLHLSSEKRKSIVTKVVEQYKDKITNDELMVEVWGYLSLYGNEFTLKESFYSAIFESHVAKQVEYLFTAGEALSVLAGGWYSTFLMKQIDILGVSVEKLQIRFNNDNIEYVLHGILEACNSTKPALKRASCIWLLSLTEYLRESPIAQQFSKDIHFKFMKFLASNDEFIQDSAARGLSLVYNLGNQDLKEEMVKGLLKSFTSTTENLTAGSVSGETQVFEPGIMNTGNGSISTYKDIMNLATEVGDPSLVYKFLTLAKSSSLWTSRKGVAFGLSAIMSKSSLEKLLLEDKKTAKKLIPILYRYRHDPYSVVSRAMNDIWNSLISDSSTVISLYFDDILEETLTGMGNKEWRVREGSVNALLQLIQSQPFEKFSAKILDLWTMGFRSMDDIKESVREVGTKFMSVLAKLLARSIDSAKGISKEKTIETLKIILPFLLGTKGLESDAEDVRKFSLTTLLDLVKNTGDSLQTFAPQMVYNLSLLFSSVEPQVINFLALNSKNYNLDSNLIDSHRRNAVTSSPIFEAIDKLVTMCDDSQVESMVDYASKAVKKSVGLPSKVAASHVIILLIKRFGLDMKPYSGKLLKVCMNMFEDRNEAINLSYAQTFGYLNKVSTMDKSAKYAKKLSENYFNPSKDNSKKVVGYAIESVLKYAPSQFEGIASSFMPLIFIGSNDVDEVNGKLYDNLWIEASATGSGTIKLYLREILDILGSNIKSNDFNMRRTCGKAISIICSNVDAKIDKKDVKSILYITIESLAGRSWDGKELLFEALVDSAIKFKDAVNNDTDTKESIENVMKTEISRNNMDYVKKVIIPYGKYLETFSENNMKDNVKAYLSIIDKIIESFKILPSVDKDDMDIDEKDNEHESDTTSSNKRVKPNYEISEKSSQKNVKNEEYIIKLIKSSVNVYVKTVWDNDSFLQFILNHAMSLFDNKLFIFTWRSQTAINDIGIKILEEGELSKINQVMLLNYWNFTYSKNNSRETTLNVKLKLIKYGSLMMTKLSQSKTTIESQLRELHDIDPTSRITAELKNIGLN